MVTNSVSVLRCESNNLDDLLDIYEPRLVNNLEYDVSRQGMIFGSNGVTLGIADYPARLLVGAFSIIGGLILGVFVIFGRKVLVEGPRAVGAARWPRSQTTYFMKKFHMAVGLHFRGVVRILKALFIFSLRTLRVKVVPRIIETTLSTGRKCKGLIVRITRDRRRGMTQNINKSSEALYKDQVEENI
jgi:hypothetical protein